MFTVQQTDDGASNAAATDTMRYAEGVGFTRIFGFIGGLGMLCLPITLAVHGGDGNNSQPGWNATCEWYDTNSPDTDLRAVGCPPNSDGNY